MKVYYFSQPTEHMSRAAQLWRSARHAGIAVDDPERGLVIFEIDADKKKEMEINIKAVTELHRQTASQKGRWVYFVGETSLPFEAVNKIVMEWLSRHEKYRLFSDNCRAFTSAILKELIANNGTLDASLSASRFSKSPCDAIEYAIGKSGFNTETHTTPRSRL